MPLSAEQQALFDHARRALPRWLTRGKTAALEWLHAYTQTFDSVRSQSKNWLDATYIDNASAGTLSTEINFTANQQVSVSNGGGGLTTVTLNSGIYTTGSLLSTLQQQLNDNAQGYPTTAALMKAATGGTWTSGAGFLCNETSGAIASVFGSPATMTATSSPTYGDAGPRGGIDKAIGINSADDGFLGGDIYDVPATDDLLFFAVCKFTSAPNSGVIFRKGVAADASSWIVYTSGSGNLVFDVKTASGTVSVSTAHPTGEWFGLALVWERSTNKIRIATRTLAGVTSISAEVAMFAEAVSNTSDFAVGRGAGQVGLTSGPFLCSAFYVTVGTSAATGLSAGLSTAISNFVSAINASWACTLNSTTGKASLSYTSPPTGIPSFSWDWTSVTLRDFLGFSENINYPITAAQVASQLGYGIWTDGAGWLCNEISGNLAAVFGVPSLTPGSSPTYGHAGPRGGPDKAIGFDSVNDRFDGGDVYDIGGADDFIALWIAYNATAPTGSVDTVITKLTGAGAGWQISMDNVSGTFYFQGQDATPTQLFLALGASLQLGEWHVGIATVDRATGKARIGTRGLTSGTSSVTAEQTIAATTMGNATAFRIGDRADAPGGAPDGMKIAAVYVVKGAGVAAGLSANLSTALSNFAARFASTQTSTLQATGMHGELDQHALDRGTMRRAGESDASLRLRLRNIVDVVTEPALKIGVDALLTASGLGPSAWVELRRDRAHYQLPRGSYPTTEGTANSALGFGSFTGGAGYLLNEISGNLLASFGSPTLTATSLLYEITGPYGIDFDKAIGFDAGTDNADGSSNFNVTTNDLLVAAVFKYTGTPSADKALISKVSGAFADGWAIGTNATDLFLQARQTAGSFRVSTASFSGLVVGEWYALLGYIDRVGASLRFGFQRLSTGAQTLGGSTASTSDNFTTAATFRLGSSAWVGTDTAAQLAAVYINTGSGIATGLTANFSTALNNFCTTLLPKKSTSFMSRGYRMTFAQQPMGYIVILPFGTTAAMGEAVEEYLRQYGPAGYYFKIEIRANP